MNISPASLSLIQSQMLVSLTSSTFGANSNDSWATLFSNMVSNSSPTGSLSPDLSALLTQSSPINPGSGINSVSATGRNMTLADPESAYKMMSVINNDDVLYKAQFSELSQMKSGVSQMQDAGQGLGSIAISTGNDEIKSRLQGFVGEYNNWIQRFNPDLQNGGLLAGTQAAQVSQFELEQNVNNRIFGGKDGVHGLSDLGVTIDPNSHLAFLDTAKLDSIMGTNKQGVVDTMQQFSANFVKSASLLNSDGNFIPNQLDNLNHAIHFIADNKNSLQAEFGTGNAAHPTGQVAQALAAYNQTCSA